MNGPRFDGKPPALTPEQAAEIDSAFFATIEDAHDTFRHWLGNEYDIDAINAVLCTLAAERLDGDPLWLLLVSGSGNAKTETVQAACGDGAIIVSTLSSEGALLSGTAKKQAAKDATGGLLNSIGARGVLVIKDVTSILSMDRNTRAALLAALREIHDGHWARNVGTDGGRTLTWQGRIAIIGAVTTAWDRAHDVIASMGDRFVCLRMDSTQGRTAAGRQAIANTGHEIEMREELANTVADVLAGIDLQCNLELSSEETDTLLEVADIVTRARTGVDYDYRGDVIDAHAPEMPTRFAKQLTQMVRGGVSIGMDRARAMQLAIRCAADSVPPLRLAILLDVADNPGTSTRDVRRRLAKPRATVDRQLQSLHMLGLLFCVEAEDHRGTIWKYHVDPSVTQLALNLLSRTRNVTTREYESGKEGQTEPRVGSNKSGTTSQIDLDADAWEAGRDAA